MFILYRKPLQLDHYQIFITAKVRELTSEGEKQLKDFSHDNYFSMLNELALELGEEGIPLLAPDERANPLRMAMAGKKNLIIFDNLETLSEDERTRLFYFLSRLPEGNKAIATTRRGRRDSDARSVRLDRMHSDEAIQLIEKLAETNSRLARENKEEYQKLYETTNGNPLLIKWVCGQLGREGSAMYTIVEARKYIESSPKNNNPLEYIFGDLIETFTENETKILATLSHFTYAIKLNWITDITELSEQVAETAIEDLADRSILIIDDEKQDFYLPPLAAQFIKSKCPEIVEDTGKSLAERAYKITSQYTNDFQSLNNEWLCISAALPKIFQKNDERLQRLIDITDRFLDYSGLWDERLSLSEQAKDRAVANHETGYAVLRASQAYKTYLCRGQGDEARNCVRRMVNYIIKAVETGETEKLDLDISRLVYIPLFQLSIVDKEI